MINISNVKKIFLIFPILIFISCSNVDKKDKTTIEEDSMSYYRDFLKRNSDDIFSNTPVFFDIHGKRYNISMDTILDEAHLLSIINKRKLHYSYYNIVDRFETDSLLNSSISKALYLKNQNPWKLNIPEEIFLNYLMPPKILYENHGDWQNYFSKYFGSILLNLPQNSLSKNQIDSLIENQVIKLDTSHIFTGRTSQFRISKWPGMDELRVAKSGDCQSESLKNVYLYRSLGIPAAVDFTPFYGGGNAGHSSAVFWDSQFQRFIPKAGQGFNPDYRVSKVFRWSYKKTYIWTKQIIPFINNILTFPIQELRNDHWLDVTDQHIPTKDLQLNITGTKVPLAFICTYSYGKWRPIQYGKRQKSGSYLFRKMGLDILYRTGFMANDSLILSKEILHVQRDGSVIQINRKQETSQKYLSLKMNKINYGSEAWIKQHENYSLLSLNSSGGWDTLSKKTALQDSLLVFTNVPFRAIYLLKSNNENKKDLERPFIITRDSITWY